MSASVLSLGKNGGSSHSSFSINITKTPGYHLLKIDGNSLTKVILKAEQHKLQGHGREKKVCFEFLKFPTNLSAAMGTMASTIWLAAASASALKEIMSKLALH